MGTQSQEGMRVVVESDGTSFGTHVYDEETGEEIKGVKSINFTVAYNKVAEVTMTIERVKLFYKGVATIAYVCPACEKQYEELVGKNLEK